MLVHVGPILIPAQPHLGLGELPLGPSQLIWVLPGHSWNPVGPLLLRVRLAWGGQAGLNGVHVGLYFVHKAVLGGICGESLPISGCGNLCAFTYFRLCMLQRFDPVCFARD